MKKDSIGKKIVNILFSILFIAFFGAIWGWMSYPWVCTLLRITGQLSVLNGAAIGIALVLVAIIPALMCWGCVSALLSYLKGK